MLRHMDQGTGQNIPPPKWNTDYTDYRPECLSQRIPTESHRRALTAQLFAAEPLTVRATGALKQCQISAIANKTRDRPKEPEYYSDNNRD